MEERYFVAQSHICIHYRRNHLNIGSNDDWYMHPVHIPHLNHSYPTDHILAEHLQNPPTGQCRTDSFNIS